MTVNRPGPLITGPGITVTRAAHESRVMPRPAAGGRLLAVTVDQAPSCDSRSLERTRPAGGTHQTGLSVTAHGGPPAASRSPGRAGRGDAGAYIK